ncbi:TPA: hypothetical protein IBW21_002599 [Escherichia coli]|nr:hypothetical protein [Escherichia coli]
MNKLPDHLPRRYIIEAIHLWDAGETHQFQPALNIMADVTPRRRLLASQRH